MLGDDCSRLMVGFDVVLVGATPIDWVSLYTCFALVFSHDGRCLKGWQNKLFNVPMSFCTDIFLPFREACQWDTLSEQGILCTANDDLFVRR